MQKTKTTTVDKTKEIVAAMMREKTGRHLLDSGDYYGRHWEENQLIEDFEKLPEVTFEISGEPDGTSYIEYTRNVYHFMVYNLEYVENVDKIFHAWSKDRDSYYLQDMEEFPEFWNKLVKYYDDRETLLDEDDIEEIKEVIKISGVDPKDLYLDKIVEYGTFNTYNEENNLSQVLQGTIYMFDTVSSMVALQLHNGADVRGGYTAPKIFELKGDWYPPVADGLLRCTECEAEWWTDDNYHWYYDGTYSKELISKQLENFPFIDLEEWKEEHEDEPVPEKGYIIKDDKGYRCPICGKGYLCA